MRVAPLLLFSAVLGVTSPAMAGTSFPRVHFCADESCSAAAPIAPVHDPWRIDWTATAAQPARATLAGTAIAFDDPQQSGPRPRAFEYSHAYEVRRKIHKYASFATLPLFATEFALGQSLYNTPSEGKRGAHAAIGSAIGVLFGVNTVTGVWNLWEGRKDPNGRTLRFVHGIMMMAADVGFLATASSAPGHEERRLLTYEADKSTHRTIAVTSIGIASASYLIMLFGGHR